MRNLVLLLTSGHTVRIELRDDDLTDDSHGTLDIERFLDNMPAMCVIPFGTNSQVSGLIMAYIENTTLPDWNTEQSRFEPSDDFQRIDVSSPGDVPA
jgi:hypothetical protein